VAYSHDAAILTGGTGDTWERYSALDHVHTHITS